MDICVHSKNCGGCIYQGVPYKEQLRLKAKAVLNLLEEKNIVFERFFGIEGSPKTLGYRNKMEYTFGDEMKGGEMTLGLHKHGSFMSVITTDQCQLVDSDFNNILNATLEFSNRKAYTFYHKKSHQGFLRHLVVRKGENTGELLINLVTSSQGVLDTEGFIESMKGLSLKSKIVGILHTVNDSYSDAVNGDKIKLLYGRDHYYEEILGLRFKVSAFSFFQTNIPAVEKLYTEAISLIHDLEDKVVFDLYSGTGTIAQAMSQRAKKVIGIELIEESVKAARENAELNKLTNCQFISGDVLNVLDEIEDKPDVIVVDPPRSGIHPKALNKILDYKVDQIVYISCNPKTMADNLATCQAGGYKVNSIKAFDNFPYTKHIECVIGMQRKDT